MKIVLLTLSLCLSFGASAAGLPDLLASGQPIVGHVYEYVTGYADYHIKDCPDGICAGIFRGKLPSSVSGKAASPKTGGIGCSTCQAGIYQSDDFHFVFVYGP